MEIREWLPAGHWSGGTPCTDPSGAGNQAAAKETAVPPLSGGDSEATHATHTGTITDSAPFGPFAQSGGFLY
jgi:hypothetical protein